MRKYKVDTFKTVIRSHFFAFQ